MSLEKLYSINSEINNMLGGEMTGGDGAIWGILMLLIITVVGIILYLSGILSFNKPSFLSSNVENQVVETQIVKKTVQPKQIKGKKIIKVSQEVTTPVTQVETQTAETTQTQATNQIPSTQSQTQTQTQTPTVTQTPSITETPITPVTVTDTTKN